MVLGTERVGIRELRDNLKDYLEKVELGGTIEITKNGRTIGMIVPKPSSDPVDLPFVPLTSWVVETAENIGPPTLCSLDALHLASAFELGDALTGFIAYDKRLRDAAVLTDLPVMTPGAS